MEARMNIGYLFSFSFLVFSFLFFAALVRIVQAGNIRVGVNTA